MEFVLLSSPSFSFLLFGGCAGLIGNDCNNKFFFEPYGAVEGIIIRYHSRGSALCDRIVTWFYTGR